MSGLCGWLAAAAPATDSRAAEAGATLAAMTAALPRRQDEPPGGAGRQEQKNGAGRHVLRDGAHRQAPGAGLALADDSDADFEAAEGETPIWAALVGQPRWSDPELAALSQVRGPAAALIAAYRRHGPGLLEGLFGHFALALLEPARGRALIAIDRFGVQRLCYSTTGGTAGAGLLVFASSADAVRAHPQVGATIHPQALYRYLSFVDRVAAPETIYQEQRKLGPGEALLFEQGRAKTWCYWQLDYGHPSAAAKPALHAALRDHMARAVARALDGEAAGGSASFLSGGLDSSTVTGLLAGQSGGAARAVTIGFQHPAFDETRYAEIAARHFGLKHEVFVVGPQEVLDVLPMLSTAYDEPYSNSSVIPCYYCALVARQAGAGLILAGDGGDELFGGNTRYLKDDVFELYHKAPAVLRRLLEPVLARAPGRERIRLLRRANNYVALAKRSVADRMTLHNAFAVTPAREIFSAEAFAVLDLAAPRRFAEQLYDSAKGDAKIHKMMHLDLQLTLADSDLRKVATSCQAAGIRVRFPMLDDDLAAFSGTLPAGLLSEGGAIRRFYKEAFADFLPPAILDKPKQGFGLPMFQYIAETPALAAFFCDALSDLKKRAFFRPAFLDAVIAATHRGTPHSHAGVLWDFAVLETWMASRGL